MGRGYEWSLEDSFHRRLAGTNSPPAMMVSTMTFRFWEQSLAYFLWRNWKARKGSCSPHVSGPVCAHVCFFLPIFLSSISVPAPSTCLFGMWPPAQALVPVTTDLNSCLNGMGGYPISICIANHSLCRGGSRIPITSAFQWFASSSSENKGLWSTYDVLETQTGTKPCPQKGIFSMGHNQSRGGVAEGRARELPRGPDLSLLLSLCDFSHPLLPSAVSSPILGSPSFSYRCSAFSSLLAASQIVLPWLTAPCPSTSSLLLVFRYSEHPAILKDTQPWRAWLFFPYSRLSSCVNLFLLCLFFTVLAWFLALLSPFWPVSLVGQISIPEMHPNVLSFGLIFWAGGASQDFPVCRPLSFPWFP